MNDRVHQYDHHSNPSSINYQKDPLASSKNYSSDSTQVVHASFVIVCDSTSDIKMKLFMILDLDQRYSSEMTLNHYYEKLPCSSGITLFHLSFFKAVELSRFTIYFIHYMQPLRLLLLNLLHRIRNLTKTKY